MTMWTASGFARLGVLLAMLLAGVLFIERRRAAGKLTQGVYSFRAVRQVVAGGVLAAGAVAALAYAGTGSTDTALGLGGIVAGVVLLGGLRGFFSEYQRKRDGARDLDKR